MLEQSCDGQLKGRGWYLGTVSWGTVKAKMAGLQQNLGTKPIIGCGPWYKVNLSLFWKRLQFIVGDNCLIHQCLVIAWPVLIKDFFSTCSSYLPVGQHLALFQLHVHRMPFWKFRRLLGMQFLCMSDNEIIKKKIGRN